MTSLKSAREVELMRGAGCIVAEVLELLRERTKAGVTTAELDLWKSWTLLSFDLPKGSHEVLVRVK